MAAALIPSIPSNRGFTEFQSVLIESLAWAEKKQGLVGKLNSRLEYDAMMQFRAVDEYVKQFLRDIPRHPVHPGFLLEVRNVLGGSTISFRAQRVAEDHVEKYLPGELALIVIQYYDPKEPVAEDVFEEGDLLLRPDMTSTTVHTRVAFLISNYKAGMYNSK